MPQTEAQKARQKQYRAENAERIKANNAAYRAKNAAKLTEYNREYRAKNLERVRKSTVESSRKWRARNPEKVAAAHKRDYETKHPTSIRHREILSLQHGVCAICYGTERSTHKGRPRRLAADHDHVTGEWRGLLCSSCNTMIGLARESQAVLQRAIEYLAKHRRAEVA